MSARLPTISILGALLALLYAPIVADMAGEWMRDVNYSHGFLVPVFSGYLVWTERDELQKLPVEGSWVGVVLLFAGCAQLCLGVVGTLDFLMQSSLITILLGLVLFHAGKKISRFLFFPITFLLFMIPLPAMAFNSIAFPLQGLAARNATWALDAMGVPVLRDGNVIQLSHVTLGVSEACSGIRSLISLLALAVVWAHLALPALWAKLVFVSAAVPITIVANAARIVLTGLIAQSFGVEYAEGFFHGFSGWVIFIVAMACLLGVHGLISVATRPRRARGSA